MVAQFPPTGKHCDALDLFSVIVESLFVGFKISKVLSDKYAVFCGYGRRTVDPILSGSQSTGTVWTCWLAFENNTGGDQRHRCTN
jgi:hypothetical protein